VSLKIQDIVENPSLRTTFLAGQSGAQRKVDWAVVGFYTYTYLLDPISYAVNAPFPLVGASLPAALMSALTYALITVLVIKPAGKGGYK